MTQRHASRLQVLSYTTPVSFGQLHRNHPRLQLVSRVTIDDQLQVTIRNFLNLFILNCGERNPLEIERRNKKLKQADPTDPLPPQTDNTSDEQEIDRAFDEAFADTKSKPVVSEESANLDPEVTSFRATKEFLSRYLEEKQKKIPDKRTLNRLARILLKNRLSIFELEDEIEASASVQTDRNGLPVDAENIPIEIDIQAIRQAIETDQLVMDEGYIAFVPRINDAYALVGRTYRGYTNLVLIPPNTLRTIVSFEEQWLETIQSFIRAAYQPTAPATGAQQEQQEPIGTAPEHPSDDESNADLPDIAPDRRNDESSTPPDEELPHFPIEHD